MLTSKDTVIRENENKNDALIHRIFHALIVWIAVLSRQWRRGKRDYVSRPFLSTKRQSMYAMC